MGDLGKGGNPWSTGLHPVDVNLAMGDLLDIVGTQSQAWLARR